jgi:hypothetical protein
MKYDIAIAQFPGDGWVWHDCADWITTTVLRIKQDERIGKIFRLKEVFGTPVTMLRNKVVLDAKRTGASFLLMADADMQPDRYVDHGAPPFWDMAWEFMMDRRQAEEAFQNQEFRSTGDLAYGETRKRFPPATIAAPYCGPPPDELPYVFRFLNRESENPNPDWQLKMVPREMAAIMGGIQQMDALPTGLILYDMRVFDILKPPWYRYEFSDETESQKVTTEDVYQTRNAGLLGLPQYAAMSCWCGHAKSKVVGRPIIITRERVAEAYRDAVRRDVGGDQWLILLPEPPDDVQPSVVPDDPEAPDGRVTLEDLADMQREVSHAD